MPSHVWPPPPLALASEVDLRAWSGVEVFTRGTVGVDPAVSLPAYADGEGWYEDPLSALCGRGSQAGRDAASDAATLWAASGAGGTLTCGLTADDFFYLESSAVDFALSGSADALTLVGFDPAGHGLVGGVAPFRRIAPNPWLREQIGPTSGFFIDPAGATPKFSCAPLAQPVHCLITWLRQLTVTADADAQHDADCLETLDNAVNDGGAGNLRIRWGVDADGKVYSAWPTALGLPAPTWQSISFRNRLGFDGTESVVSSAAGFDVITANHWLPGGLFTSRPPLRCFRTTRELTEVSEGSDGDLATTHVHVIKGWGLRFRVDGPAAPTDLEEHWYDHVLDYIPRGYPVNVYRGGWFEPRRYRPAREAGSGDAYTLLYTAEGQPPRGRLRCKRAANDRSDRTFDYDGRDLALYQGIDMKLQDRVD